MRKVKQKVVWVHCCGEAHSNPHIDHCGVCMPYWEKYPTCPCCKRKLMTKSTRGYFCNTCKVYICE